jgi:hypothetical protein
VQEHGWLKAERWSDWLKDGEQSGVVEYPGLSRSQINRLVDEGLKKFYFRPSFMVFFVLNNRSYADLYRKVRGAFNFISYLAHK